MSDTKNRRNRTGCNTVVRRLSIADIAQLVEVYISLSEETKSFFHPFPFKRWALYGLFTYLTVCPIFARYLLRILPRAIFFPIVAVDKQNGVLIGFAYFHIVELSPSGSTANIGIMVQERYRRQGVASQLMGALIDEAVRFGVEKLILTVVAKNEPAIRLYQRFGFSIKGLAKRELWRGTSYKSYKMSLSLKRDVAKPTELLRK